MMCCDTGDDGGLCVHMISNDDEGGDSHNKEDDSHNKENDSHNTEDAPQATFSAKLGASTGPSDPKGLDSRDFETVENDQD